MPIYETMPDVFPPRVEPVNSMGDVPAFAFADGDAVAAWSLPDEFVFAEVAYRYILDAPGWPKPIHVALRRMSDPDAPGAERGLDAEVTENLRRLDALTTAPMKKAKVRRVGGYHRETQGPPRTVDLGWFGRIEAARGEGPLLLRESWVFAGAAKAVQVQIEQDVPEEDPRVAREVLARVFAERVEHGGTRGLSLWTLDLGCEMVQGCAVAFGRMRAAEGIFEEDAYIDDYLQGVKIEYDVMVPGRTGQACDDAAARRRATELFSDRHGVADLVHGPVPAHGHVLLGGAEMHRPQYVWEGAVTGAPEVSTAETIRVAFVAAGSAHAVRIMLQVGSLAEPQLDGLWRSALERLYVTCPRERDVGVGTGADLGQPRFD